MTVLLGPRICVELGRVIVTAANQIQVMYISYRVIVTAANQIQVMYISYRVIVTAANQIQVMYISYRVMGLYRSGKTCYFEFFCRITLPFSLLFSHGK